MKKPIIIALLCLAGCEISRKEYRINAEAFNCFRTKREAEKARAKIKAVLRRKG